MNNDLETILDTCLYQIEEGESSIDECLARYPEHAAQLQPLLVAATKLARGREVMPDPSYRLRARSQLNVYMQRNPQRKRVSPMFWRFSIAFATVMMLFLASGTAFAQQALPGDALYNWKLTSEHVWRYTSSDQIGYDIALSNRRMNELLVVSGDEARRASAIQNYERLLIKFQNAENAGDRARILPVLRAQHQALLEAGVVVPELEEYFPR
ncbi:MAG TPA: hypothetical protein VFY83_06460 [Anaerolineales bacterium]|jgi:hypothetical protein|nr:hypothetical protein [Anaerolineales bacterium]